MSRTRVSLILICMCFTLLTQSLWGQSSAARIGSGRISGDALPKPNAVADNLDLAQAALTTFTGTLQFKYTITVKSTNLGADTIVCGASADVIDENRTTFVVTGTYIEEASVVATRGTGTASCTVNIPYSWSLANSATDTVDVSYVIQAANTTANGQPTRFNTHSLSSIKIPANGATTVITVTATI
jgi:hypothetical protein